VKQDVERRLVTREGARRYGVVLGDDGSLDTAATEQLRAEIVAARKGEKQLFNFGGDIEDIRARCAEETHLAPPVSPTFAGSN
jgi:N-methylhydantoinase B